MMSALQRIVLVAAILAIVTAVAVEGSRQCFKDANCQDFLTDVSCMV